MPDRIALSIACGNYDRTRALFDGAVRIEGCDPTFLPLTPEEMFFRAFVHQEFDVAELSLSSYVLRVSRGDCPYIAIPAFLSRSFRHSCVYVRTDRGIAGPQDLKGRPVGTPEFQLTASVWIRGILEDDFGLASTDPRWLLGGQEMPGRVEKVPFNPPANLSLTPIAAGKTLSAMLEAGEIDALVTPRAPSCFMRGAPHVGRLFPDFGAQEEDYYRRTGIFPIMHVLGIRRSLVERHPWLASSLLKAFTEAKNRALHALLHETAALPISLPSAITAAEEAARLMGTDFWPYGLERDRETLARFLAYHHGQGISARQVGIEELFVPSSVAQFKV